jgi:hypothetical protein
MQAIGKGLAAMLLVYTTHYSVAKLYNHFCVPDTVYGFFQGMISTGSPVCMGGMEILKSTQTSYGSLIMLGTSRLFVDIMNPFNTHRSDKQTNTEDPNAS